MEWSSETHCFIHDEIVTVLSKMSMGFHLAFSLPVLLWFKLGLLFFCFPTFPSFSSENEASQLHTWMLDLMTQCSGHRPEHAVLVWSLRYCGASWIWCSKMAPDLLTKTWEKNIGDWKSRTEIWVFELWHFNLSCSLPDQWPSADHIVLQCHCFLSWLTRMLRNFSNLCAHWYTK